MPHIKGCGGVSADHFRAASLRSSNVAQQEINDSHPFLQAAAPSIPAEQLRTQVLQLSDHLTARQHELDRREAELKRRETALETSLSEARQWLAEREAALEGLRQQWIDERRKAEAELDAARQRMDEQFRRDWAELNKKRRAVELRSEQVDRAAIAVQQMWEEVARLHRDTLEQRLAHEELAAQLGLLKPLESHQRTLAEIRTRLAEEYRRARDELARRRHELVGIRRELSAHYRKLVEERDRLYQLAAQLAADRRRHAVDVARTKQEAVPHA